MLYENYKDKHAAGAIILIHVDYCTSVVMVWYTAIVDFTIFGTKFSESGKLDIQDFRIELKILNFDDSSSSVNDI